MGYLQYLSDTTLNTDNRTNQYATVMPSLIIDSMHELQEATAELSISDEHAQRSRKPSLKSSRTESESNTKARKRVQFSHKLEEHREIPTRWETLSERLNLKPLHRSAISDHELSSFHGQAKAPDTPPPWHIEHVESKMSWDSDDGLLPGTEHDTSTSMKESIPVPAFACGRASRTASPFSPRTNQTVSRNVPLSYTSQRQSISRAARHVVRRRQNNTQHGLKSTQERKTSRMSALRERRLVRQRRAHQSAPRRPSLTGHFDSGMTKELPAALLHITAQGSMKNSKLVASRRNTTASTQLQPEKRNIANPLRAMQASRPRTYIDYVRAIRQPSAFARIQA